MYDRLNFFKKLNRDLTLELGPYLNLFSRLVNKDTPRSIALAKRTYQRSTINREKVLLGTRDSDTSSKISKLLDNVEDLKTSTGFKSELFIENMRTLIKLLD